MPRHAGSRLLPRHGPLRRHAKPAWAGSATEVVATRDVISEQHRAVGVRNRDCVHPVHERIGQQVVGRLPQSRGEVAGLLRVRLTGDLRQILGRPLNRLAMRAALAAERCKVRRNLLQIRACRRNVFQRHARAGELFHDAGNGDGKIEARPPLFISNALKSSFFGSGQVESIGLSFPGHALRRGRLVRTHARQSDRQRSLHVARSRVRVPLLDGHRTGFELSPAARARNRHAQLSAQPRSNAGSVPVVVV